jgi:hypothetical protein
MMWGRLYYNKKVPDNLNPLINKSKTFKASELLGLNKWYEISSIIFWGILWFVSIAFHLVIIVFLSIDDCTFKPLEQSKKFIVKSSWKWVEGINIAHLTYLVSIGISAFIWRIVFFLKLKKYQTKILKEVADERRKYFFLSIWFTSLFVLGVGLTKFFPKIRELYIFGDDYEWGLLLAFCSAFVFTLPSSTLLVIIMAFNMHAVPFAKCVGLWLQGDHKSELFPNVSYFIYKNENYPEEPSNLFSNDSDSDINSYIRSRQDSCYENLEDTQLNRKDNESILNDTMDENDNEYVHKDTGYKDKFTKEFRGG